MRRAILALPAWSRADWMRLCTSDERRYCRRVFKGEARASGWPEDVDWVVAEDDKFPDCTLISRTPVRGPSGQRLDRQLDADACLRLLNRGTGDRVLGPNDVRAVLRGES